MRARIFLMMSLFCLLLSIAGCGGGGGDSSTGSSGLRKAVSSVALPGYAAGLQLTLTFPYGVTVATDANGEPTADVVQLLGGPASTLTHASYIAATTANNGQLKLIVTDVNKFVAGESVSIVMNIAPGYKPVKADFAITDLILTDVNGVTVSGLTPEFTLETL